MSRRAANNRNGIRGPASALTDFLRSTGITPATIAQRAATRQQEPSQPEAGPSNAPAQDVDTPDVEMGDPEPNPSPRRRRRAARADDSDGSENLDEPVPTPTKKRKMTKAQETKAKAAATRNKKKQAEDQEDEDEDAYTALSKSAFSVPKPPNGSMIDCAKCENKFTVTKYTMAAVPGPGWLCHVCTKSSGVDPFKKPAAPKKRKAAADKRNLPHLEEKRFPSLVSLCVQVVSSHIDQVDALGDIGSLNLQEIAKAIAKNRSLTAENVQLFYNSTQPSLVLFDATNLLSPAYETLALLNPSLTSLRLDFCGRMDSPALISIGSNLPDLTHIDLLGPFLVRKEAWQQFLTGRKLISFKITQSPRFDVECLQTLLDTSRDTLEELRLCEVGQLDDAFLEELKGSFSSSGSSEYILHHLDLSLPSTSCSSEALIGLLETLGPGLEYLDLSGHDAVGDDLFTLGIQPHTTKIHTLIMSRLLELSDEGIAAFFQGWENHALTHIDLSRTPNLSSLTLDALLDHSGSALEQLNINAWKETSQDSLASIAVKARELRKLDVSWCREVNDFVLKEIIGGSEKDLRSGLMFLNTISIWGCGRVNGTFPRRKGLVIHGLEGHGF